MLKDNIQALLELYGEKIVEDIRKKMAEDNNFATGSASRSLSSRVEGTSIIIEGNRYIGAVSEGVPSGSYGDTVDDAPSPSAIGEWIQAKGIIARDGNQKALPFKISKSIQQFGMLKKFRNTGGGTGLLDFVINKTVTPLANDLSQEILEAIGQQIEVTVKATKGLEIR